MNRAKYLYTISILLLINILIYASPNNPSIFDQLDQEEVLQATIELDIAALTEADWRDEGKHRAVFSYEDENKEKHFWNIKLQKRGKFRRLHCEGLPPLKMFFDKEDLEQEGLAKFNDMKIVNYCLEDKETARELILKEYLAYKMYNELTEESFRVKLLKVNYQDVQSKRKLKQWVILIEDTAEMRDRIGAKKYKMNPEIADNHFDTSRIQLTALFQYMIGNADWDMLLEKNAKVVEKDDKVITIPYDFDFSGLVNPPYGTANTRYNLTTLTERVYLGPTGGHLSSIIRYFDSKKDELAAIIETNRWLSGESKETMVAYLDSFYDDLNLSKIEGDLPQESYTQLD
ncbi:MAG: hypothetical protein AAF806_25435 [Bacteroidota bacterium]